LCLRSPQWWRRSCSVRSSRRVERRRPATLCGGGLAVGSYDGQVDRAGAARARSTRIRAAGSLLLPRLDLVGGARPSTGALLPSSRKRGPQHLGPGRRLRRRLGGEDAATQAGTREEAAPPTPPPPPRLLAVNSRTPCCPLSFPPLPSALAPPSHSSPPIGGGSQLSRSMREGMHIGRRKPL
jgi:hypothetical protein